MANKPPSTKRSGGPKTAAGKSAIAHNAIKTGAYSNLVVLPGEMESEFHELLQQFQHDFSPQDVAESAMVRELAVVTWKQLRLERMQHSILLSVLERRVGSDDLRNKANFTCSAEAMDIFERYDEPMLAESAPVHSQKIDLTEALLDDPSPETLAPLKAQFVGLYEHMKEDFKGSFSDESELDKLILETYLNDKNGLAHPYLTMKLKPEQDFSNSLIWVHENHQKIKQAIQTVKAQRVMEVMQNVLSARVYDDLQRSFYRTLSELRRHQSWRYSQRIVEMTPTPALMTEAK